MPAPFDIHPDDPLLKDLPFKPYRNISERHAKQFLPAQDEQQTFIIDTPWGEELEVTPGDFVVNPVAEPDNRWPVEENIFKQTHTEIRPGVFIKSALTHLCALEEITGDPDRIVNIHSLEGVLTVRAGDFYLARGIEGEIWTVPGPKVGTVLKPVEHEVAETK